MFTGKNKEDFEKWMYGKKVITLVNTDYISKKVFTTTHFYNLPFSMQQGVYLEYLDSVGYVVEICFSPTLHLMDEILMHKVFDWNIMIEDDYYSDDVYFYSRQEALTEAFKKADELINKI